MPLKVLPLSELLMGSKQEVNAKMPSIQNMLNTFETISITGSKSAHDVDNFLKNKSVAFDKQGLARTYLILSRYKRHTILVGYFTISNKPLVFTKRMLDKCSKTLKKKLCQKGEIHSTDGNLIIQGYLVTQIGKNYSKEALATRAIDGKDLLTLAYEMIESGAKIFGGSYIWVEYENNENLKKYYKDFGFTEIDNYTRQNGLCLAIMRIKQHNSNHNILPNTLV